VTKAAKYENNNQLRMLAFNERFHQQNTAGGRRTTEKENSRKPNKHRRGHKDRTRELKKTNYLYYLVCHFKTMFLNFKILVTSITSVVFFFAKKRMFCGSESFKDIVGMKKRYTGK
jgi:hypothetical protein